MLVPAQSAKNLRRLAALGLEGDYGFFDAVDYTDRAGGRRRDGVADTARPVVVRTFMAHHQGMTLVALANALLDDRMVSRFHLDSRVRATELLLQERRPRVRAAEAAAARSTRCAWSRHRRRRCGGIARRTPSSRTRSSCRTGASSPS